jgi:hypothetical protein
MTEGDCCEDHEGNPFPVWRGLILVVQGRDHNSAKQSRSLQSLLPTQPDVLGMLTFLGHVFRVATRGHPPVPRSARVVDECPSDISMTRNRYPSPARSTPPGDIALYHFEGGPSSSPRAAQSPVCRRIRRYSAIPTIDRTTAPIPNTAVLVLSPRVHPSYAIHSCSTATSNVPSQPHIANAGSKRFQFCTLMVIAAARAIATSAGFSSADQDMAGRSRRHI